MYWLQFLIYVSVLSIGWFLGAAWSLFVSKRKLTNFYFQRGYEKGYEEGLDEGLTDGRRYKVHAYYALFRLLRPLRSLGTCLRDMWQIL
jgi:hypothetical protein